MDSCKHSTILRGMCCDCGQILTQGETSKLTSSSLSMVHSHPELLVTIDEAKKISQKDADNLISAQKLIAIVDLDHTLIHTCSTPSFDQDKSKSEVEVKELEVNGVKLYIAIRPGCIEFLKKLSEYYELHVFTLGTRDYAHQIVNLLDPKHTLIHERIRSRCDSSNPAMKSQEISAIFPATDHMVVVLDDREDVWNGIDNLIQILPFLYHETENSEVYPFFNRTFTPDTVKKIEAYCSEISYFDTLLENLIDYHSIFYDAVSTRNSVESCEEFLALYLDENDNINMKNVISFMRSTILKHCRIVFSGIIPVKGDLTDSREYLLATFLGAQVHDIVTPEITHLITNGMMTRKVKKILNSSSTVHIVSVDWLYCCYYLGKHASELPFKVEFSQSEHVEQDTGSDQTLIHEHSSLKRVENDDATLAKRAHFDIEKERLIDEQVLRDALKEIYSEQSDSDENTDVKNVKNEDSCKDRESLESGDESDSSSSGNTLDLTEEELQKYVDTINSFVQ